nr:ankycorbin [Quercus suber]
METKLALSAAVLEALNEDNYMDWSVQLKTYLVAQDLWEIVGSRSEPPPVRENEAAYKAWSKKNAIALHAIQMSCRPDTFSDIREISSARIAWNLLAEKYETRDPNPSSSLAGESDEGNINDGVEIYLDLYKALQIGDWDAIEDFLNRHPHAISAKITSRDKTALHVAAEAGHVHIVEELVNLMSEENLEIKDNKGRTALDGVACRGNYRMAECMLEKNERLIRIEDDNGNIPVVMALYNGHLILARYLYLHTPLEILMPENSTMGASIIYEAILNKALDIALHLAQRSPSLVLAKARNGDSPFYALSRMPDAFPSGNRLVFWKRWIYSGTKVTLNRRDVEAARPTAIPRATPHDVQLPTIVSSNSYGNPENLKSEMEITTFITSEGDVTNETVTFPILSYIQPTHKDNIKEIWDTQIEGIVANPEYPREGLFNVPIFELETI